MGSTYAALQEKRRERHACYGMASSTNEDCNATPSSRRSPCKTSPQTRTHTHARTQNNEASAAMHAHRTTRLALQCCKTAGGAWVHVHHFCNASLSACSAPAYQSSVTPSSRLRRMRAVRSSPSTGLAHPTNCSGCTIDAMLSGSNPSSSPSVKSSQRNTADDSFDS